MFAKYEDKKMMTKRNRRKNVLFVSDDAGIIDTAMYLFASNAAALFMKNGYHVTFVCKGNRAENYIENHHGMQYYYASGLYRSKIHFFGLERICQRFEPIAGRNLWQMFTAAEKEKCPSIVIMYGYASGYRIYKYCRSKGIKYIVCQTDWFESSDRKSFFSRTIYQIYVDWMISSCVPKADGVITVSDYLMHFFKTKKCKNVLMIHAIFSDKEIEEFGLAYRAERKSNDVMRVSYAGNPGSKDIIFPVIEALKDINRNTIRIELHLVGVDYGFLNQKFKGTDYKALGIYAYGMMKHDRAVKIVADSDFSLLLRQNKRYAKAGFSTKFAESMLCGVPVICTVTGGTDRMVKHMENGVLIADNSVETIKTTLKYLLSLDKKQLQKMKENARNMAVKEFALSSYTIEFSRFLKNL